ncbi:Pleiotropic drug resistance protein 4 [Morus notabilis]|uniref:Pleiotropic drug resistance protein 4 n=1 Tax=Morus notabilis TaxID=981085 RepID=W9RJ25_9ROSA|nr:Pleiotropic drug resistance protein 4 [Morus notabilis]
MGNHRRKQQDLFNAMGAMDSAILFIGVQNGSSVQPVVAIERTVFYRERAAGMYSALPYAFEHRIRIWWRWYYWSCPVAWTLYGLVTSQFGDVMETLETGETVEYFIFRRDFHGVVALVSVGIPCFFGFLFAYSIKTLNFEKFSRGNDTFPNACFMACSCLKRRRIRIDRELLSPAQFIFLAS